MSHVNTPFSTLGRVLVPDFDRVFRRFPIAAGLIVALLLGIIVWGRDLARFKFDDPPYQALLRFDEAIQYCAIALIFAAVALALVGRSLRQQAALLVAGAGVCAALVHASYAAPTLSRFAGFEPWHLLAATFMVVLVCIGTASRGAEADGNRQIAAALMSLPFAFLLAAVIIGLPNLFLSAGGHRYPFWVGAFSQPLQAIYLATALFYWLAWLPELNPEPGRVTQSPGLAHAVMRRLGIPFLLVFFGLLALIALGVTVTWTGLATTQGKPDFPLELSNPALFALLLATVAIKADRERFGASADTFLRFAPMLFAAFALFHAASLYMQMNHLVTGTQALHVSVYAHLVVGVAAAVAALWVWRKPVRDIGTVFVPLAAAFLFLCAGPWGMLSVNRIRLVDTSPWAQPTSPTPPTPKSTPAAAAAKMAADAAHAKAAAAARREEERLRQALTVHAAYQGPLQLDLAGYTHAIGPLGATGREVPHATRLGEARFGGVIFDLGIDEAFRFTVKNRATGASASYELLPHLNLLVGDEKAIREGTSNPRLSPRWTGKAPILRATEAQNTLVHLGMLPADLAITHLNVTALDSRITAFTLTFSLLVKPGANDTHFTALAPDGPPPFGSPLFIMPGRLIH